MRRIDKNATRQDIDEFLLKIAVINLHIPIFAIFQNTVIFLKMFVLIVKCNYGPLESLLQPSP